MKDIRLLKLANTIKLNENFTKYLENAELKEVLLNKKTNKMTIVIINDFLFPIVSAKEDKMGDNKTTITNESVNE